MQTKRAIFIKSAAAIATLAVLMLASPRVSITQTSLNERITGAIDERSRSIIQGHLHPLARPQLDQGRLSPVRTLHRITMMFKRTAAQQRNLAALLVEQQNPASPNYHRWLSPEEFADRFGLSSADLDKIARWLQNQGFTIDDTARSRSWITFSGTVQQMQSAFNTEMHEYLVDATRHYAAATEPSVPTAMGDVVLGFGSLNDFRLKPRVKSRKVNFTSNISGNHFLTPDDLATIYNVRPLYSAGLDGTGQKIAVMGQTNIIVSDILAFRTASGLPVTPPTTVLVPGSADPGINPDDLGEADLDLEWAGALAPNAEIIYVNSSNGVFDSFQYSIGQNLASAISISYGDCERNFSRSDLNLLGALAQQANAQGITISAAAGDSGATDCDGDFTDRQVARLGLTVDAPASFPYVTAVGGTTLYDVGNYWSTANNGNNGSALSYIPEVPWNDTLVFRESGLSAAGGGSSIYFSKPDWQSGPGVLNNGARDIPDISVSASLHDAYLICSMGSCVDGYRASDNTLFAVHGTSAGPPVVSGIVALLNQRMTAPQGNVNPGLYRLAQISPSAFHDISTGGNWMPCQAGTRDCPRGGLIGYGAGQGYDLVTGLGSLDVANLITSWPLLTSTP